MLLYILAIHLTDQKHRYLREIVKYKCIYCIYLMLLVATLIVSLA